MKTTEDRIALFMLVCLNTLILLSSGISIGYMVILMVLFVANNMIAYHYGMHNGFYIGSDAK